jgi:hypothetical protein
VPGQNRFPGATNNGSIRQKGARRYRPDGKTVGKTRAWGSRPNCRGRHRGAIQFVRRAEETDRLDTTTGGSLPLNLTYSLVKEHLVLRRQPLDHSSSTVTGFARRTRVSVPCVHEANSFEFGTSTCSVQALRRRSAHVDVRPPTESFLSSGFASPTCRQ